MVIYIDSISRNVIIRTRRRTKVKNNRHRLFDESAKRTAAYYDKQAQEWAYQHKGFDQSSFWNREIDEFHKLLPNGKIIEIGSGAGREAHAFLQMGYDYTGVDASRGLIKLASRKNPGASFINMNASNLNFIEDTFNAFWTSATLMHISKKSTPRVLREIHRVTKNNGIGFVSMLEGTGEHPDDEDPTGRWFSYYKQKEFKIILEKNGFKVLETAIKEGTGKRNWITFFVKVIK